jgi:hypothetical protein
MRWLTICTSLVGSSLAERSARSRKDVRGSPGRRRDLLALQVGDRLDRIVAHPELRGRVLDVVQQEDAALAARREVGDDGAGRQDVEAAADHRLEQLEAGRELDQLHVQPALGPGARLLAEPDLAVDRGRVEVADAQLGARLREGVGGETGERCGAGGGAGLKNGSATKGHGGLLLRVL